MFRPIEEGSIHGGTYRIFRFDNGYGASVVRHCFSYGHDEGLWELAVVKFTGRGPQQFELCYSTPITGDVIGYLNEEEVQSYLKKIEML